MTQDTDSWDPDPDDEGQLSAQDTLSDRVWTTCSTRGIAPPEKPRALNTSGVTQAEAAQGESLDRRLAQEEPDPTARLDLDDYDTMTESDEFFDANRSATGGRAGSWRPTGATATTRRRTKSASTAASMSASTAAPPRPKSRDAHHRRPQPLTSSIWMADYRWSGDPYSGTDWYRRRRQEHPGPWLADWLTATGTPARYHRNAAGRVVLRRVAQRFGRRDAEDLLGVRLFLVHRDAGALAGDRPGAVAVPADRHGRGEDRYTYCQYTSITVRGGRQRWARMLFSVFPAADLVCYLAVPPAVARATGRGAGKDHEASSIWWRPTWPTARSRRPGASP
jgi:hypothetical protein